MLDRTIAPSASREFSFDILTPDKHLTPSGIPIYFLQGGEQNVVRIEFVLESGSWEEPATGVAYFTSTLLNKGTRNLTSYEIAAKLDTLGAHLEITPSLDHVSIVLTSLTKKIDEALDLLTEIILYPTFQESEFEQAKSIYLQNLSVNKEKTSFLASRLFRSKLFGNDHPYGANIDSAEVEVISKQQLVEYHKAFMVNPKVFVAGKLTDDINKKIEAVVALLPFLGSSAHHHEITGKPNDIYQERKESIQTSIRIGKLSVDRSHSDFPALLLLNHILGGYFGSRLMHNIREEKGLTYGIYSGLYLLIHGSYQMIATDVNKENKDVAIREIKKELEILCSQPIDKDELDIARSHFLGNMQSDLSTTFAHAEKIKNIALFQLSDDYYNNLLASLNQLDSSSLLEVAKRHFIPESYLTVAVG